MNSKTNRRSFIGKGALAGGALALGTVKTAEAKRNPFKRKSPSSAELLEVGVLTTK